MSLGKVKRPAIKSGIGIWNYYVSTMTFEQVASYVKMPDEIYTSKKLSDMIQRSITDNVKAICEYINVEKERFFNSLVLAVYSGEPKWFEGVFEKDGEEFYNIGVLEFTGNERIFPVDGQHRVAAIKEIVKKGNKKTLEEIPVIFIAHENSNEGIKRTRRLFTTLNRYAKPVKLNEIIALDEDDIVAIVTRQLVEESSLFSDKRISVGKSEAISRTDDTSFTTIMTLYKCNEFLLKCYLKDREVSESISSFKRYRKNEKIIRDFYDYTISFWKMLGEKIKEISDYLDEADRKVGSNRSIDGGHLLFRPAGLKAYVEAVCEIHIVKNVSLEFIVDKLVNWDLNLNTAPWKKVIWDDIAQKMIMNHKGLIKKFIFYYYDQNWTDIKGKKLDVGKMADEYASLLNYDMSDGREAILGLILQKDNS